MQIVIGSHNKGKIKEFKSLFEKYGIEVLSVSDFDNITEPVEDGLTFSENALIKAKGYYEQIKLPVLCDDSGLCIEALNLEPGIYSARYSSDITNNPTDYTNCVKLLSKLENVTNRKGYFECHICYYDGINIITGVGHMDGSIANEIKGSNGFGYDPLFIPEGYSNTFAELGTDFKCTISHRHKALVDFINNFEVFIKNSK